MEISLTECMNYYLAAVNVIGFFLFMINLLLHKYTEKGRADHLLAAAAVLGGSPGILLAVLLFDRKPVKENMMFRVFLICVFVIQMILLLFVQGVHKERLTLAFWDFFAAHRFLVYYLGIINFVTFAVFALDKINAAKHRPRIRIVTLLGLCFIGGSAGGLTAMYLLRHKTKKDYFTVGIPLIMLMQVIVMIYVMNL